MTRHLEDLIELICGSATHPLAALLRPWGQASRPVLAFLEAHATKLRKKVRLAQSEDEQADLRAELSVGYLLARDRRVQLQYEPQPRPGTRSPDFLATFRTHTPVYVEVTRLRLRPHDDTAVQALAFRLARVLCDKVSQGVAGAVNVLVVVLPEGHQGAALVPAAVQLLHIPHPRMETGGGLSTERLATYWRLQGRLSAVLLCSFTPEGEAQQVSLWQNPQARHPLPGEFGTILTRPAGPVDDR